MGRVSFTPLSLRSTVVHCDPPRSSRYFRSVLPSLRSLITFHRSEEPTGDHMGKESDEWAWSVHIMKENKTKKQ